MAEPKPKAKKKASKPRAKKPAGRAPAKFTRNTQVYWTSPDGVQRIRGTVITAATWDPDYKQWSYRFKPSGHLDLGDNEGHTPFEVGENELKKYSYYD